MFALRLKLNLTLSKVDLYKWFLRRCCFATILGFFDGIYSSRPFQILPQDPLSSVCSILFYVKLIHFDSK